MKTFIISMLASYFAVHVTAFTPLALGGEKISKGRSMNGIISTQTVTPTSHMSSFDDDFLQETPDQTRERIQDLVDENPVLLFMKGSKIFPQCGFSSTAVQILNTFGIEFQSVDVLADESIRQGVKEFSQWPTIPQLYVCGEFIGGSDIMIEMYQSGELGEMIEKAKADMI
eukprot:CAMPEP_0203691636 /NCGR_PEP_ID=MMETSP0091-20130426/3913_1 /ASSEMBLY_ACC=CAM_ASM_001089 /TAXON_ID=426623 /ORGANISM="Chaetoceros affinis, Strain CCMP159" /LENGTH=170 /DNA_ID=CAMNT_0050562211 /DNA_START=41 /DNA_END=553 /DNA_ORIENTATION=-